MSQAIATNDVLECVIEGSNEGSPWAIVRHYIVTAVADNQGVLDAIASSWETSLLAAMQSELTDQWMAECLSISRVGPQIAPAVAPHPTRFDNTRNVYFYSFAAPLVGSIATDGVPNGTALVGSLQTGLTGPSRRGRIYFCGLPEASTNGGVLLATKKAAWEGILNDIALEVSAGGNAVSPAVFSRTLFDPAADPVQATSAFAAPIESTVLRGNLGSQRGRRYRRSTFG